MDGNSIPPVLTLDPDDPFRCDGRCDEMGCRGHSFRDFAGCEERLDDSERARFEWRREIEAAIAQVDDPYSPVDRTLGAVMQKINGHANPATVRAFIARRPRFFDESR